MDKSLAASVRNRRLVWQKAREAGLANSHRWLGLAAMVACLCLSACAAGAPTPLPPPTGLDPTHFLQTRVPQVLTESAATQAALPTLAATSTGSGAGTPAETPAATPPLTRTPTPLPTPTSTPTVGPTPRPTLVLSNFPNPPAAFGGDPHFFFSRPVGSGGNVFVASSYRYGDTGGQFETHHGVEFGNPQGTPLVAVAPGSIYYVGDDLTQAFGAQPDFYGNLVVLQLAQTWHDHTVYALYGHMDQVQVQTGQNVNTGDLLGTVGQTGVAFGPHLHLEVRLDNPQDYWSTVNPELWLAPGAGTGTLVIRVVNEKRQYLPGVRVDILCRDGAKRYLATYWDPGVNPDPVYGENAAMTDVPAGKCHVQATIFGKDVAGDAYVAAGGIGFVELRGSRSP